MNRGWSWLIVSLLLLCLLGSCSARTQSAYTGSPPSNTAGSLCSDAATPAIDRADCAVLSAALVDLSALTDFNGRSCPPGAPGVVLHNQTLGESGYIEGQLDVELEHKSLSVPEDAMWDLRQRNKASASMSRCAFDDSRVASSDLKRILEHDSEFGHVFFSEYPTAKGYAFAWLPGYSKDGCTAIVRFLVGPTAHGATATYLLRKEGDGWAVKWRFMSYYL
jgi:hypothetical protein